MMRPRVFDGEIVAELIEKHKDLKHDEVIVAALVGLSLQLDYISRLLETQHKAPR
jgi:hypothetical protein